MTAEQINNGLSLPARHPKRIHLDAIEGGAGMTSVKIEAELSPDELRAFSLALAANLNGDGGA